MLAGAAVSSTAWLLHNSKRTAAKCNAAPRPCAKLSLGVPRLSSDDKSVLLAELYAASLEPKKVCIVVDRVNRQHGTSCVTDLLLPMLEDWQPSGRFCVHVCVKSQITSDGCLDHVTRQCTEESEHAYCLETKQHAVP